MSATHCYPVNTQAKTSVQVIFILKKAFYKVVATLSLWYARAQQRHKLKMSLEDEAFLKDIGVSLWDARVEANKPFWK